MKKISQDNTINRLHTNVSKELLGKSTSKENKKNFVKTVSSDIISAQKYYVGNPDGKFITEKYFDKETVNARKAYETINTLMGNDKAEFMRFSEGKKQTPGLITPIGLQKIVDMVVLLFTFANNGKEITYETVRACRQTEISETRDGEYEFIDAFQSTTKATIKEIIALGYGNKNKLAICKLHFNKGAIILDMERFGKEYLKPEEKEVLILTGNKYKAKCLGYSDCFFGKDRKPALMYDVEVFAPDKFNWKINEPTEKLKQIVFNEDIIIKVNNFYKALNTNIGGEYPKEPKEYRYWKKAFKQYIYSELNKIY